MEQNKGNGGSGVGLGRNMALSSAIRAGLLVKVEQRLKEATSEPCGPRGDLGAVPGHRAAVYSPGQESVQSVRGPARRRLGARGEGGGGLGVQSR